MKFHLIYDSIGTTSFQGKNVFALLKSACVKKSVEFVPYDERMIDLFALPALGRGDLLYRAAIFNKAVEAQRMMISAKSTSFHTDWRHVFHGQAASYFLQRTYDLPVIPSFSGIPASEEELDKCVKALGPFPLIIKVTGNSLGVGVMRVDSLESMRSVLDYLKSLDVEVLVRKYIEHKYYVRAVVVGDRVIASHAAYALGDEFRTNAGDDTLQKREAYELTPEQQEMVVKSVRVLGIETAGVDLLFDKDDTPYIAEVNFPNNFTTTQCITGIDVASEMVNYLLQKSVLKSNQA